MPQALLSGLGRVLTVRNMRSLTVTEFGGPEKLELIEHATPPPRPMQLRVRLAASSVNPIDLSTLAGRLTDAGLMAPAERAGLGWDVAGTVTAVGAGVTTFRTGDEVVGLRDLLFAGGAHADEVILHESAVAAAPTAVSLLEAATLPLNALTAARALDLAALDAGQTLLITGAAGGVGGFALELAALRGCRRSRSPARGTRGWCAISERPTSWREPTRSVWPYARWFPRESMR